MMWLFIQILLVICLSTGFVEASSNNVIYWDQHLEPNDFEVPFGTTLVLSGNNQVLGQLRVAFGAVLTVNNSRETFLRVGNLDILGSFFIGSEIAPYANKAIIEMACGATLSVEDERRKGVVVREGGEIALFGAKGSQQSWVKLSNTTDVGATCLQFDAPADWSVGDEIVISSTDFDPHQTEKRTIVSINANCIEIDHPLDFGHFGQVVQGVDERAEIGLLTRDIVFRGCHEVASSLVDLGGHMMFLADFKRVQIQAIELQNFGQGDRMERYPFYFHMCASVPEETFLRHNAVYTSNSRAMTLHGTQGVTLNGNVAFNITGHGVVLEDGAESGNTISDNLVVLVKSKNLPASLESDRQETLSAFWLTNFDNIVTGNAAAAIEGAGFWLHTRLKVKGESDASGRYNSVHPYKMALREMHGNSAHSSRIGIKLGSSDVDAQADTLQKNAPSAYYTPDELAVIDDFLVHHCRQGGWFATIRIHLNNWIVADVTEGIEVETPGNPALHEVGTYITNSLFVGGTSNRGNLVVSDWQTVNYLERRSDSAIDRTSDMRLGIKLSDGPMFISNCTFADWYSQPCMNYINAAIGMQEYNAVAMPVNTFVRDLVFQDAEYPLLIRDRHGDGGKTTTVRDAAGSISGHEGAILLPDWEFYATKYCRRSVHWGLACPHEYANFDIVVMDSNQDPLKYGQMEIYRNNMEENDTVLPPRLEFGGQYAPESLGWRYHPILSSGAVYTLRFQNETPSRVKITMSDTRLGQIFTLVICYPAETSITAVLDQTGRSFASMESLSDTQCVNCYFYDPIHNILSLRLQEKFERIGAGHACPISGCSAVEITTEIPISSTVKDALSYALSDLKVVDNSASAWINAAFSDSTETVDDVINTDWCSLNDPCLNGLDDSNRRLGILAYFDEPCAGIGCFSSSCQYCKLNGSTATAPFLSCPYDPHAASAEASPSPTGCSSYLSSADIAVGVNIVADSSCASGGLGCLNHECRYCKSTGSTTAFLTCSELKASAVPTVPMSSSIPSPTPLPTDTSAATPIVTSAQTSTPTPTPTQSPTSILSPTGQPVFTSELPLGELDTCSVGVPTGDKAVGISAVLDTSCADGGSGCFSDSCRYCSAEDMPASRHFPPCVSTDSLTGTQPPVSLDPTDLSASPSIAASIPTLAPDTDRCWSQASADDLAVGIASMTDYSCRNGGLGCHSSICRFCQTRDTPESQVFQPCSDTTNLDSGITQTPTTTSPSVEQVSVVCRTLVTSGDIAVGISAVDDPTCAYGGLGCVHNGCRFCQTHDTVQSRRLLRCGNIVPVSSTGESWQTETTAMEADSSASSSSSTNADVFLPAASDVPVSSADPCFTVITPDEVSAGILAFTNSTCLEGDEMDTENGCFNASCQRCRATATTNGSAVITSGDPLSVCPAYVAASIALASRQLPQNMSADACALAISFDAAQKGLSAYADAECNPVADNSMASSISSTGCFARLPCRYCSYGKTLDIAATGINVCLPESNMASTNAISSSTAQQPIIDYNSMLAGSSVEASADIDSTTETPIQSTSPGSDVDGGSNSANLTAAASAKLAVPTQLLKQTTSGGSSSSSHSTEPMVGRSADGMSVQTTDGFGDSSGTQSPQEEGSNPAPGLMGCIMLMMACTAAAFLAIMQYRKRSTNLRPSYGYRAKMKRNEIPQTCIMTLKPEQTFAAF